MLLKTPMVVSNRCAFMAIYNFDLPNGGFVSMSTSKGMKAIDQANVQLQGKDVLSHTVLTFHKAEPMEDGSGVRLSAVACVDIAGSLPDFIKN